MQHMVSPPPLAGTGRSDAGSLPGAPRRDPLWPVHPRGRGESRSPILLDVREAVEVQIEQGATEDRAVAGIDLPQYRRFQGYSRAMEMAIRRVYQELTTGLD